MLEAIGTVKGPFAQALAELISDECNDFDPPAYLREAIDFAHQDAVFADALGDDHGSEETTEDETAMDTGDAEPS